MDPFLKLTTGGVPAKKITAVFPRWFQKEEIQQWRQARLRPGEKETLNIMLRGKMIEKQIIGNESRINELKNNKL